MKRQFIFLFLLLTFSFSFSQVANNLSLLSRVDNNNLPVYAGIVYNEIWGWADVNTGREYAIMGSLAWTYFIEVTNPTAPVVIDSVPGKYTNAIHRDYKTYGHYCYGVADEGNTVSTLQVIDMAYLPDSVHVVWESDTFFNRAHNIFIDEEAGRLYTVGSPTQSKGCILLDIATDPENPALLSSINLGQYAHDIYVRNDTAWFNCGTKGLYVYDYTSATNPVLIGVYNGYAGQGYNHSSWLTEDGQHLIMADETHNKPVKIVSVGDLGNMSVVSSFQSMLLAPVDTTSIPHNPLVAGKYACVSYYHDGVQIYDVSNPANPVNVAWYDTDQAATNYAGYKGCWGVYPFLPSGNIIASDVKNGLFVLGTNFPFPYKISSTTSYTDVTCNGGNNGSATASPIWGGKPYSFSWSNGDTTATVTSLAAGTYYLTITDKFGDQVLDTITISQPTAFINSFISQDETCFGVADGSIDLTLSGGVPPYQVLWSTGDTTEDLTGLAPGTYWFAASDSNGCLVTDTIVLITQNAQPLADAGSNSAVCAYPFFLNAQPASVGTGTWSVLSGSGNFPSPNSPTTNVSGLTLGLNKIIWTVANGPCISADTISLIRYGTVGTFAGPDEQVCSDTWQLNGNFPVAGAGTWNQVVGVGSIAAAALPSTGVSGLMPGASSFAWTVTDGPCTVSDTVDWNVEFMPIAGFSYSNNQLIITFADTSENGTTWSWDFGDSTTSSFQNPTHSYTQAGTYTVCQWVNNVCGMDSVCTELLVSNVGIAESNPMGLKIFPNPAQDRVFVEWNQVGNTVTELKMYNISGQLVMEHKLSATEAGIELDLRKFKKGLYALDVVHGDKREIRKLILK